MPQVLTDTVEVMSAYHLALLKARDSGASDEHMCEIAARIRICQLYASGIVLQGDPTEANPANLN